VIGCNDETLAMYKKMRRFCVSTKHLLAVPHIAPGTCMLFLYNIMTQQTSGVYQSSSYGMQQVCYTSALMLVPYRVISIPESGVFIYNQWGGQLVVLSMWHREGSAEVQSQQRAATDCMPKNSVDVSDLWD
jgi:hypothetical protein